MLMRVKTYIIHNELNLVEREMHTRTPEVTPIVCGVSVVPSLVLRLALCKSLFVPLSFTPGHCNGYWRKFPGRKPMGAGSGYNMDSLTLAHSG